MDAPLESPPSSFDRLWKVHLKRAWRQLRRPFDAFAKADADRLVAYGTFVVALGAAVQRGSYGALRIMKIKTRHLGALELHHVRLNPALRHLHVRTVHADEAGDRAVVVADRNPFESAAA